MRLSKLLLDVLLDLLVRVVRDVSKQRVGYCIEEFDFFHFINHTHHEKKTISFIY